MSFVWSQSDANGRITPGEHWVKSEDLTELLGAVNRRKQICYQSDMSLVTPSEISTSPITSLRTSIVNNLILPTAGVHGGTPSSPESMRWLWPEADADENSPITMSTTPPAGEVNLFAKINSASDWTDAALQAGQSVRTVHINELRTAAESLSRGVFRYPIYFAGGLYSALPDMCWFGGSIAKLSSGDELRTVGYATLLDGTNPVQGPANVTVRSSSSLVITASAACSIEVYHCLRDIDFAADLPSWNDYAPIAGNAWEVSGGAGAADAASVLTSTLQANTPTSFSNASLTATFQNICGGGWANFLIRRTDTGSNSVSIGAVIQLEFDLNTPPN